MPTSHEEQLQLRIRELEKEVARLHAQIKHQRYGLNWIDVPEAFDHESENRIPTLEEVPELSFKTNDDKPTHILIEGDNYHALTCLNYTHRGKVDVIYIDPPYNTGTDGFVYKDKRILDRYPDGTPVPAGSPQRHSYWLSFMHRRLELAKSLLSERGVIFISIDDNEQANLKLLCDEVFGAKNFVANVIWKSKSGGANDSRHLAVDHEYILCYGKRATEVNSFMDNKAEVSTSYNLKDEKGEYALDRLDKQSIRYSDSLNYEIKGPDGMSYWPQHKNPLRPNATWRWSKETVKEHYDKLVFKNGRVYTKNYKKESNIARSLLMEERFGRTRTGKTELANIIEQNAFSSPKPSKLIVHLLNILKKPTAIILDFFAGSGTTLHATMSLNEEDGGKRQCILVQLNEADICRNVTYERNRRVMQGYTDAKGNEVEGLGNSLKYYRTAFVGENDARHANEQDRLVLSQKAGCLLALAENTLDETLRTSHYQLFTDGERLTAVYFQEDLQRFEEFVEQVRSKALPTSVYVFCWGSADEFLYNFEDIPNVSLKSIPEPILKIYQTLNA